MSFVERNDPDTTRTSGVVLEMPYIYGNWQKDIRQADDDGTGSPDSTTWEVIRRGLDPGTLRVAVELRQGVGRKHFEWRLQRDSGVTGSWVTLGSAKPRSMQTDLPPWGHGKLRAASLSVTDDGTDESYSLTFNHGQRVFSSYDLRVEYFKNDSHIGTNTGVDPTSDADSFTDSGAGAGDTDDHHAVLFLSQANGDLVQTLRTPRVSS